MRPELAAGHGRSMLLIVLSFAAALATANGQPAAGPAATGSKTSSQASAASPSSFDVISIKPSRKDDRREYWEEPKDDGIYFENTSVKEMIASAYGFRRDLILGGPGWADSLGFDVQGKVIPSAATAGLRLSRKQIASLTKTLLADRFALAVHTETRQVPVYELAIAKGGPKLKESTPGDTYAGGVQGQSGSSGAGAVSILDGTFTGQGITLSRFASILSQALHITVVDSTGLKGIYDISIPLPHSMNPESSSPPPMEDTDVVFASVEDQLGLKLRSTKGPGIVLVIDHIEKPLTN